MSAHRTCMCLLKKTNFLKTSNYCVISSQPNNFVKYLNREPHRVFNPWQTSFVCYSTAKKSGSNDNVKGLTDEILRSKIREEKDKTNNSQSNEENDPNKKSKSNSRVWEFIKNRKGTLIFVSIMLTGVAVLDMFGEEERDPENHPIKDEFSEYSMPVARVLRTKKRFTQTSKEIKLPSREKLLPDPLEYPYLQPPYTLVIEMKGVLVHPDWNFSTGWRFKKRKGIDYFLSKVGPPLFEVVIYTSENGMNADHVVNNIDPQGYIMYRLYRDATNYIDGHHIKDLSCLNRDLSKVIMVDFDESSVKLQRNNAFIIKRWHGEEEDRDLFDLANFLNHVGTTGVKDVRPVMEYYQKYDDPLQAFREYMQKFQEDQEKKFKEKTEQGLLGYLPFWKR